LIGSPKTTSALPNQDARRAPSPTTEQQHDDDQHCQQDANYFSSYQSPFQAYPRLRSRNPDSFFSSASIMYPSTHPLMSSLISSSSAAFTEHTPFLSSSVSSSSPDLKPLRLIALSKRLDPSKRICQYEVPGGGVCRDDGCEDVHLSRLEGASSVGTVEPSGTWQSGSVSGDDSLGDLLLSTFLSHPLSYSLLSLQIKRQPIICSLFSLAIGCLHIRSFRPLGYFKPFSKFSIRLRTVL